MSAEPWYPLVKHHRLVTRSCLHLSNPQNSPSLCADRCSKIKRNFSWPRCSHSTYKLKNYVVMICLPLPCCQLSSAITAIVINEGSIYQPATTRFLVFTSGSPPPLLLCGFYFFICFSAASIPPFIYSSIHPSISPYLHPSIIPTQPQWGFLCVCTGKAEMLPVTLELQPPIQAAWGGPAAVNQSVAGAAEGLEGEVGLTHGRAPIVFRNSSFSMCSQPCLFQLLKLIEVFFDSLPPLVYQTKRSLFSYENVLRVDTTLSPISLTFTLWCLLLPCVHLQVMAYVLL